MAKIPEFNPPPAELAGAYEDAILSAGHSVATELGRPVGLTPRFRSATIITCDRRENHLLARPSEPTRHPPHSTTVGPPSFEQMVRLQTSLCALLSRDSGVVLGECADLGAVTDGLASSTRSHRARQRVRTRRSSAPQIMRRGNARE